jgi:UDP-N-acetyl-D-mannosaminuronic acid dehydrogenase
MRITVIGLGYVGLPTATVFAKKGYQVVGIDSDKKKIELLNKGVCYIREPGIDSMLREGISSGRLKATINSVEAIQNSDIIVITVPTPVKDDVVDLSFLREALENVANNLHREQLVVIESTVPPGTTDSFAKQALERSSLRAEEDFYLAHIPERIAPGRAVEELLNTPRVIGGVGPRSTQKAFEVYSRINPNLYLTDVTTAEFVKLIENTYRDLNIAFANLIAIMAERINVDAYEAIRLANTHPRVNVHRPGAGVGGPCLTKDPYLFASILPDFWGTELIRLARKVNDYMPYHMIKLIQKALEDDNIIVKGARIAVLGAAYKGGVDDIRESPSKIVVKKLLEMGADVVVFDPYSSESFGANRADNLEDSISNADLVAIMTDHLEFRQIDWIKVTRIVRRRIIVDGRRIVDSYKAVQAGFKYYSIGLGRAFKL